jgi:hypothetical protein
MKKAFRVSIITFVLLLPHEIADEISPARLRALAKLSAPPSQATFILEDGPVFNITPANLPLLMDKIMPAGFTTPALK